MKTTFASEAVFSRMVELRRTFHRYPELAFKEKNTALPEKSGYVCYCF